MQRLWIGTLGEQAQQIAAGGGTDARGWPPARTATKRSHERRRRKEDV